MIQCLIRYCLVVLFYTSINAQVTNYELLDYLRKANGTEQKKIGAEKTPEKRFTGFRAFTQNNFTYFNFFFNANDQFQSLIKVARQKVYNKNLKNYELSFGNEDLAYLKENENLLDSILVKCNAGILLHDLRNKWVDDLLLLMGKCYYYKEEYDIAFTFFQYINNAYKTTIGYDNTTLYVDKNEKYSISSVEKRKSMRFPPTRNEALIWIARTLSAMGDPTNALGIIDLLSVDVFFPKRLKKMLLEAKAFLFYQDNKWGEAAEVIEDIIAPEVSKRKKSTYLTNQLLLSASLYKKDNLYHDAYRVFKKAARLSRDMYKKMYAEIQALGLDYKEKISEQIKNIASNKKYKKYRPYLLYEIIKKLYDLKEWNVFNEYALQAFEIRDQINEEKKRKLVFMLVDYFTQKHEYAKAGYYLAEVATLPNQEEIEKYNIVKIEDIQELYTAKQKIDLYDSLLRLGEKSEKEINTIVKRIRQKHNRNSVKKKVTSYKKSKASNWYFDNQYILLKGSQEFEEQYGLIMNADMWRVQSVNNPINESLTSEKTSSSNPKKDIEKLINQIPTTENTKRRYKDTLFYALGNYVKLSLNKFHNHEASIPFLERAINMQHNISLSSVESNMMSDLVSISNLLSNKKPYTERNKEASSKKEVYREIAKDYFSQQYDRLISTPYKTEDLSPKQLLHFQFMQASSYAKKGMKKEAAQVFRKILSATPSKELKKKIETILSLLVTQTK